MYKYSFAVISIFLLVVIGCSSSGLPGMGGTSSPEVIERNDHPAIPVGVACYVCHKEDIPQFAFHADYDNDCSQCHITTTWMANDYAHPAWHLDENHRTRCTRCHTASDARDYTIYQCWGCHHEQAATQQSHAARGITDISNCIACHQHVDTAGETQTTE